MKKILVLLAVISVALGCSNRMTLADGKSYKLRLASNGLPYSAVNEWAKSTISGTTIEFDEVDGNKVAYTAWSLGFTRLTNELQYVQISEVSREKEIMLVEKTKLGDDSKFSFLSLDRKLANETESKWLFEKDTTMRIFKYELFDLSGESKILYQPTVVTEANKKTLLAFMALKLGK